MNVSRRRKILGIGVLLCSCSTGERPRIRIDPHQGSMICFLHHPAFPGERFSLQVPETIASQENTSPLWLINHNEASFNWTKDPTTGTVRMFHVKPETISFTVELTPSTDHVDISVTISNLSQEIWHDVFSFNCGSPNEVTDFKDEGMERTYLPIGGRPVPMSETTRIQGRRSTIQVYAHESIAPDSLPPFIRAFQATSLDRVDGSWMVKTARSSGYFMAALSPGSHHLFNNQKLGCLHASANFGTLDAGDTRTVVSRFYIMPGGLEDFLAMVEDEKAELRQLSEE